MSGDVPAREAPWRELLTENERALIMRVVDSGDSREVRRWMNHLMKCYDGLAAELEAAEARKERWAKFDYKGRDELLDALNRAEAAEERTAWLQEACDALVLTWRCETCGWETTMPVPGFGGDGRFHYGDDNAPCGPLVARRAALSLSDGKGQDS